MIRLKASIKKEIIEVMRTKKGLALAAMALFFAVLDPVMLKLTPLLLEEFSGVDLSGIIQLTQVAQVGEFYGDLYQLYTIVLTIIISGVWIKEVTNRTLVIPKTKGLSTATILLAKLLVYCGGMMMIMIVAYSLNYWYSGLIFGFDLDYIQCLTTGLLMGSFYAMLIGLIILLSTWVSHIPVVTFMTLIVAFAGPFLADLFKISRFTPFELLKEASLYPGTLSNDFAVTVLSNIVLMCTMFAVSVVVAEGREVIHYK